MYNYYQIKKNGEGFIYYRIGYSPTNNFEYYESKDSQKWTKIDALEKGTLFELRPNKNKTITFSYNEDAENLVLDCNNDITSTRPFYNEKLGKVHYDLPDVTLTVFQVYQLKLVKIAFTSLPLALQENKLSSEEPITNNPRINQWRSKATLFFYNEDQNKNWEMSACEKISWFCFPIVGWAYLIYYYICTSCYSTANIDEEPANHLYCI
ncbi:MAG: hypothetical protein H0U70_04105 [Tatlockia sp.]|nr:hypothetical protein [Tatlockia sp.]